jgi:hypothetical protein
VRPEISGAVGNAARSIAAGSTIATAATSKHLQ